MQNGKRLPQGSEAVNAPAVMPVSGEWWLCVYEYDRDTKAMEASFLERVAGWQWDEDEKVWEALVSGDGSFIQVRDADQGHYVEMMYGGTNGEDIAALQGRIERYWIEKQRRLRAGEGTE